MRYLLYSIPLWLIGCTSAYKGLAPQAIDQPCVRRVIPHGIRTSWYTTSVDVVGRHISGLLLVKEMPDSTTRVVFTNEAGVTFFDFEFGKTGAFKARQVIKQLDRKPVIETLQKDFALALGIPFRQGVEGSWKMGEEVYFGVHQKKETAYFITGADCASLRRLEIGSRRKPKVTAVLYGSDLTLPDSIVLKHHTFAMAITLKKLERS